LKTFLIFLFRTIDPKENREYIFTIENGKGAETHRICGSFSALFLFENREEKRRERRKLWYRM
jgi:hypothetical protein